MFFFAFFLNICTAFLSLLSPPSTPTAVAGAEACVRPGLHSGKDRRRRTRAAGRGGAGHQAVLAAYSVSSTARLFWQLAA